MEASINPRKSIDSIVPSIAPKKQARLTIDLPTLTVEPDEELCVMSFNGSARAKQGGEACSDIVLRLPAWTIFEAASKYLDSSTINEAAYEGTLLGFDLLKPLERRRLIIWRDYTLEVRQMRGKICCKASGVLPQRARNLNDLQSGPSHEILHVKQDWNQSADQLASAALHQKGGSSRCRVKKD